MAELMVSPTAKAVIMKTTGNHIQLDHPVGAIVTVDLTTRRIHHFKCSTCPYATTWDVIDVVRDPNGPCRYFVPVEMLDYKETIH